MSIPEVCKHLGITGSIMDQLDNIWSQSIIKAQNLHFTGFVSDFIWLWNTDYAKNR